MVVEEDFRAAMLVYEQWKRSRPPGAPEFVRRLNAFEEAEAGSTVIFECQWKGFPNPAVKWYKDDEEVTENPRYQVTAGDQGILALVIEEARKEDEGAYKCKAENQEGVASTTGELEEKPLAAQPRKNPDHSISSAPPLRTIMEQRTLELEEEEELSQQPPSPIQDFIDSLPRRMRGKSRKSAKANSEEGDEETSGSDTSVDSQDFDRVPDRDQDLGVDQVQGQNSQDGNSEQQSQATPTVVGEDISQETRSPDTDKGQGEKVTVSQEVSPENESPPKPKVIVQETQNREILQEGDVGAVKPEAECITPQEVNPEHESPPKPKVIVQETQNREILQEGNVGAVKPEAECIIPQEVNPEQEQLTKPTEVVQETQSTETPQETGSLDIDKGQGQSIVSPEVTPEQQVQTPPIVVVQEEATGEAEESLGRVPSDKAMSMFVKSVSELTPSPSVDEPETENGIVSASAEFPTQEQSDTEFVQFEVKPDNSPVPEAPPTPDQKSEVAAGPQEPGSPHRAEMVLMIGSSQPAEVQSTEKVSEIKSEATPATPVVAPQVNVKPTPISSVIIKSTENVPQTNVEPTPVTSVIIKSTENVPQTNVQPSPATSIQIKSTESVPTTNVEAVQETPISTLSTDDLPPSPVEPTPTTPITVKSTENVPVTKDEPTPTSPVLIKSTEIMPLAKVETASASPVITQSTENVPQEKVEPATVSPVITQSTENVPQTKVEPASASPIITQSTENVPQAKVEPASASPIITQSTENMPCAKVEATPITSIVLTSTENMPKASVITAPTPPVAMQLVENVPQTKVIVSSTVSEPAKATEIVPKTHVILSAEQKQVVVISTNKEPVSRETSGATTAIVSPIPKQETSSVPGITVIVETTGKDSAPIEARAEGTVSNIIKMVKQKSMAMEETLRIPWLYYFAFTVVASFIATATDCSPFHYIIVIAVVSLISFRVLVEITCKENDAP